MIPFGAYNHTRFLFEKAIGATFNLGIKMAVVSFICIVGAPILSGMIDEMSKTQGVMNNITMLLQILFGSALICVLARKVPAMAAGFFNGQPSLGGGDMFAPVKSAANAAKSAYNMAGSAAGQVMAASTMPGGRNSDGSVNIGGSLKNLAAMSMKQPMTNAYHGAMERERMGISRNFQNKSAISDAKNGVPYSPNKSDKDKSK